MRIFYFFKFHLLINVLIRHSMSSVCINGVFDILDVNECTTDPCINNGTCINTYGSYYCRCPPGWEGVNCMAGKLYQKYHVKQNLVIIITLPHCLSPQCFFYIFGYKPISIYCHTLLYLHHSLTKQMMTINGGMAVGF